MNYFLQNPIPSSLWRKKCLAYSELLSGSQSHIVHTADGAWTPSGWYMETAPTCIRGKSYLNCMASALAKWEKSQDEFQPLQMTAGSNELSG